MAGLVSWGELDAAGDVTTGALIARDTSRSARAVDDRVRALGPELVGYEPDVIAAAEAAVTVAVSGLELMPKTLGGSGTETVDLASLRALADVGVRLARADFLLDGPSDMEAGNPLVNVEVFRNAQNAVTQRLTTRGGMWWRTASGTSAWNPWQRVAVTKTSVVAAAAFNDGEVLLELDPYQVGTDFDQASPLAGFTPHISGTANMWDATTSTLFPGRTVIQKTGSGRALLAWDRIGTPADVELLCRGALANSETSSSQSVGGVMARSTGDGVNGYWAGIDTNSTGNYALRISLVEDGNSSVLASVSTPITTGDVYMLRFRVDGENLMAKLWLASAPEPAGWTLTATDNTYENGKAGLCSLSGARARWDFLSVGWDGSVA